MTTVFLLVLSISGSTWHPQLQLDTTLGIQGWVLVVVAAESDDAEVTHY